MIYKSGGQVNADGLLEEQVQAEVLHMKNKLAETVLVGFGRDHLIFEQEERNGVIHLRAKIDVFEKYRALQVEYDATLRQLRELLDNKRKIP